MPKRPLVKGDFIKRRALMLVEALHQLHEGSVARYRLRRSEYLAWQLACVGEEGDHLTF